MPQTRSSVTVDPTKIGTASVRVTHPSGTDVAAYTTVNGDTAVTWPDEITASTTYHLTTDGDYLVSVKVNDVEVADGNGGVLRGSNGHMNVAPSLNTIAEIAAGIVSQAPLTGAFAQVVGVAGFAGADPTGASSSQTAIDAAIAALPGDKALTVPTSTSYGSGSEAASGGVLYFGPGVWVGRVDLSGLSNVTVHLANGAVLYNDDTEGEHAIEATNAVGSTRNRLAVVGEGIVMGNASSGDGIHFENVDFATIEGVHVLSHGGHGIYVTGVDSGTPAGLDDKIFRGVFCLYNGSDGCHIEQIHEPLFSACHFEENGRYGFYSNEVTELVMTGCSIEDNAGTYDLYLDNARQTFIGTTTVEGAVYIDGSTAATYRQNLNQMQASSITYVTSTLHYLHLTDVVAGLTATTTAAIIEAVNCDLTIKEMTVRDLHLVGGQISWNTKDDSSEGSTTVQERLSVTGGRHLWVGANGHRIKAGASSAQLVFNGGTQFGTAQQFKVDGNGQTNVRLAITGWNSRTLGGLIDDVAHVAITGGLLAGSASWSIDGTGTITSVQAVGMILSLTFAIAAGRTGQVVGKTNVSDGTATVTDNTSSSDWDAPL